MSDEALPNIGEDIRDIRNDIERIKSDTHNINRIMTISNSQTIINDLKSLIGDSEIKAAVLHLTRNEISAKDLAEQIGQDPRNLTKFVSPFTNKKAYISEIKKGRNKFFIRAEIVDLINFESIHEFAAMLEAWESKRKQKSSEHTSEISTFVSSEKNKD